MDAEMLRALEDAFDLRLVRDRPSGSPSSGPRGSLCAGPRPAGQPGATRRRDAVPPGGDVAAAGRGRGAGRRHRRRQRLALHCDLVVASSEARFGM
jgi:hypothetical protein